MVSVAGSIPGGVAVNSAAYVGYRLAGIIGAVIAVIAITLPTFAIVFILNSLGIMFQDVPKVEAALKGVHAAVVALIIVAALKVGRNIYNGCIHNGDGGSLCIPATFYIDSIIIFDYWRPNYRYDYYFN